MELVNWPERPLRYCRDCRHRLFLLLVASLFASFCLLLVRHAHPTFPCCIFNSILRMPQYLGDGSFQEARLNHAIPPSQRVTCCPAVLFRRPVRVLCWTCSFQAAKRHGSVTAYLRRASIGVRNSRRRIEGLVRRES